MEKAKEWHSRYYEENECQFSRQELVSEWKLLEDLFAHKLLMVVLLNRRQS